MKIRVTSVITLAVCFVIAFTSLSHAQTILGTGSGSLLGGDLTDPENDGAADANTNYNWIYITSTDEPGFGGGEYSYNIFDNGVGGGNNKWCCNDPGADGHQIDVQFADMYELTHFTITSSNDSTGRDPTIWSIQGSNDGLTWTPIYDNSYTGNASVWTARNQVVLFSSGAEFAAPAAYSWFRYEVLDTVSGGHALNEIEYFGIYVPPTTPGDILFWDGTTGNWTDTVWLDDVPGTGTGTGTYPQNIADVVNPANITGGTVTVNSDEEAYSLTMDTGSNGSGGGAGNGTLNIISNTLDINTDALIANSSTVNISAGATLDVGGTLTIDSSVPLNNSGTVNASVLAGTGTAILNTNSLLSAGNGSLGAITLTGNAETQIAGTVTVNQLNIPAGVIITKSGNGTLDVTGTTTLTTTPTYNVTAGTLEFSGVINQSSASGIIKNGNGTLLLGNNNSYTGTTTINDGIVHITNGGALGTDAGDTIVNNGGQLRLSGGISTPANELISINGAGNGGAIYNLSQDNEINGAVSLTGNSTVRVDNGRIYFDGGLNLSGNQLITEIDGGQSIMVRDNPVTGSGVLRKQGDGWLYMDVDSPAYTGQVQVNNGYLDVRTPNNGIGTGTVVVDGDGTLLLRDGSTIGNSTITISTDGDGTAGAIRNENNTNTITGNVISTNNNSRIHLNNGQLNLQGNLQLNNNVNIYGNGTLNITGQVTGGGALNKNDGGTTILANVVTPLTGDVNVNGGTLTMNGPLSNNNNVSVASGAAFNVAGGALNNFSVAGIATTSANMTVNNLTVTGNPGLQAGANVVSVNNSMQLGPTNFQVNSGNVGVSGTVTAAQPDVFILNGNVTVTTPQVPTGQPTNGLLGMWTFDDGTASDLSGNGHHGTLQGSPTINNSDLYHSGAGMSLNTNGNASVIIGGNEGDFDTGDALSVAFWAKERPDGNWEPYISKRGEGNGWQVRRHTNHSDMAFTLRGTPEHDDNPDGSFDIGDNNGSAGWFHVVARFDGTTEQLKELIINGDTGHPDISAAQTGSISNTGSSLVFGARDNSNNAGNPPNIGNYANIKLDDVFIYDRWLTDAEIASIYNGGAALTRVDTPVVLDVLQGNGTMDVSGTAGLEVGGSIEPGPGIDTMSIIGDTTLAGALMIDLDGATDSSDVLEIIGDFDITSGSVEFNVLSELDDEAYIFAEYDTLTGESFLTLTGVPEDYEIDYNYDDLNQIALVALAVPEPTTIGLWLLGLAGLVAWRKRK